MKFPDISRFCRTISGSRNTLIDDQNKQMIIFKVFYHSSDKEAYFKAMCQQYFVHHRVQNTDYQAPGLIEFDLYNIKMWLFR